MSIEIILKYRSRTDIMTMILETARNGAGKTKIMYKAYLSYSQLTEYLKYLKQTDLLKYEEGTQTYRPTEKGLKFLKASDSMSELIPIEKYDKYVQSD